MSKFTTREQKLAAVERMDILRSQGQTNASASGAVGCSIQQYQRWKRGEGLGKRGVSEDKRTGRPPVVELTDGEWNHLHWCAVKKESTNLAVEKFIREGQARPEVIAALSGILDKSASARRVANWPLSVRRACKVSNEEAALFRGAKHTQDVVPVGYRRLTWIDEEGNEHTLQPGDLYESDDMSINQPFRYAGGDGQETLGRQVLISQGVQSLFFLGATPIGRPKDAYRGEDIADHMLSIVEAWGLPLWWRLERGPWENTCINGVKLDDLGNRFEGKRWGAMDDLFGIIRAYGSRGKGAIEGSFNFLQALLAHENDTPDIGRQRGEYEAATKVALAARNLKTPELKQRQLDKFWSIDECANGLLDALESFNGRPKQRREWGAETQVPAELWEDHPGKRELLAKDRWYFYPVKKIATVRQGQIVTTDKHWGRKIFTVNGVPDAPAQYLPHGLKVLIAFDPSRPECGAYICNAETGSLNRQNWGFGELLVPVAPDWDLESPVQIDLRSGADKRSLGQSKRNASTAVRTEFRATREAGKAAETPVRNSVARDGLGNHLATSNRPGTDVSTGKPTATASPSRRNHPAEKEVDLDALTEEEEAMLSQF